MSGVDAGWLQKDMAIGKAQAIGVSNSGLDKLAGYSWEAPLWLKVTVRKFAARDAEVAVQMFGDPWTDEVAKQWFYGRAAPTFDTEDNMGTVVVPIAFDESNAPTDPPDGFGWAETLSPVVFWRTINWAALAAAYKVETTYGLEWWLDMLFSFTDGLKTAAEAVPWTLTEAASIATPDDVLLMVDDDLDVDAVKAKLNNGLLVIHSCQELEPEPDFKGSPRGRQGREYSATISVFAKSAGGVSSDMENALKYVEYYSEDVKQHLAPSGALPNLLSGYLYFSRLEMISGPHRADEIATDGTVARVDYEFHGFKMQLEGE